MAGYKTISIMLLIVLVALVGGSPVFAQPPESFITLNPEAACPGAIVNISGILPTGDIVGGGISIAAVSRLDGTIEVVLSSDPAGLIDTPRCAIVGDSLGCTFFVSESTKCGHYTVTATLAIDESGPSASASFDVAGSCCAAVGGCVQPVNTFALVAPWLAVISLVGCISTVVVVARKRRP